MRIQTDKAVAGVRSRMGSAWSGFLLTKKGGYGMYISKMKGGSYEDKSRESALQAMRPCLASAQVGDPDLPKVQKSVLRSAQSIILSILLCAGPGYAEITEASYYTEASCIKESGQAIMANGRRLDDDKYTAASWEYDFGTRLLVYNRTPGKDYGRSTYVTITDRGPAKRLYRKGRKIDLSRAAFLAICPDLRRGIITVEIKEVK